MRVVEVPSNAAGSRKPLPDACQMLADHSSAIQARLRARFPEVPAPELGAEIDRVFATFADARVTAYLPVLAERSVVEALSRRR